jgi:hypothetical protein
VLHKGTSVFLCSSATQFLKTVTKWLTPILDAFGAFAEQKGLATDGQYQTQNMAGAHVSRTRLLCNAKYLPRKTGITHKTLS